MSPRLLGFNSRAQYSRQFYSLWPLSGFGRQVKPLVSRIRGRRGMKQPRFTLKEKFLLIYFLYFTFFFYLRFSGRWLITKKKIKTERFIHTKILCIKVTYYQTYEFCPTWADSCAQEKSINH